MKKKTNKLKNLNLRIITVTFIAVHLNHPCITFFEKVIQQKTHTHNGTNGTIGTNEKAPYSNGFVGEYASH